MRNAAMAHVVAVPGRRAGGRGMGTGNSRSQWLRASRSRRQRREGELQQRQHNDKDADASCPSAVENCANKRHRHTHLVALLR
jgi:hypothetical protein